MRGWSKHRLGHGLAVQPSRATVLHGLLQRAPVQSPRADHAWDGAVACSPAARRWLNGGKVMPEISRGSRGRCRARRRGQGRTGTVRRCKWRWATAFVDGEGAPVVAGGGDEALQLGRGEGVSDLQEILGIGSSGWSSPGSGGRRRCSARIREGEGAVGGWRRRFGHGKRWGSSGA
jgi:hypothetical protein